MLAIALWNSLIRRYDIAHSAQALCSRYMIYINGKGLYIVDVEAGLIL